MKTRLDNKSSQELCNPLGVSLAASGERGLVCMSYPLHPASIACRAYRNCAGVLLGTWGRLPQNKTPSHFSLSMSSMFRDIITGLACSIVTRALSCLLHI